MTMNKGAHISACGKYRYQLWRIWDETKPLVLFIMLNPSTADGTDDDPTIRRCVAYAIEWGYGGIYVGNLFSYRARNPEELLTVKNPNGVLNSTCIEAMVLECDLVVFAWGNAKILEKRNPWNPTIKKLKDISCRPTAHIEMALDGKTPKHPLYLKSDLKPVIHER